MWLHGIMYDEMEYFNGIMHGAQPDEKKFKPLLTPEKPRQKHTSLPPMPARNRGLKTGKVKLSES